MSARMLVSVWWNQPQWLTPWHGERARSSKLRSFAATDHCQCVNPQLTIFSTQQCDWVGRPLRLQISWAPNLWKVELLKWTLACGQMVQPELPVLLRLPRISAKSKACKHSAKQSWCFLASYDDKKYVGGSLNFSRIALLFVSCFIASLLCPYLAIFFILFQRTGHGVMKRTASQNGKISVTQGKLF